MKRAFAVLTAVVFVSAASVNAGEMTSGPKKGSSVKPFHVTAVNGEKAGESHCYRCQYGDNAVACIFTTEINDTVVKAMKALDKKIGENKDLKGFVVYCTDDTEKAESKLKEIAKENKIENLPLTVFSGKAGPKEYELNKDVATTLICWKSGKVEKTKAYESGKFCDQCCGSQIAAFIGESSKGAAN